MDTAPRIAAPLGRQGSGRMTSRAAVLGLVACAMVLTLAFPVRELLAQRAEIARLHAQKQQTTSQIADAQRQLARWNDPAYVQAQATRRLQYVKPGDTAYVVTGAPTSSDADTRRVQTVVPRTEAKDSPWYSQLWSTVRIAGAR